MPNSGNVRYKAQHVCLLSGSIWRGESTETGLGSGEFGSNSPSRQTLTLSTPVPRQSPAGTQKPSLVGLSLGLMRTSLGGANR